MAETLAVQLDRLQTTIAAIESGQVQSLTIQGRTLAKLPLKVLYDREKTLERRIADAARSGGMSRTVAEM